MHEICMTAELHFIYRIVKIFWEYLYQKITESNFQLVDSQVLIQLHGDRMIFLAINWKVFL